MTCEKRSGSRNRSTCTVPGCRRARGRCGRGRRASRARRGPSRTRAAARRRPRRAAVVPAIGFSARAACPRSLTSVSGEEPTSAIPSELEQEEVRRRVDAPQRAVERERRDAGVGRSARCESTIWNASPARMCSFAALDAALVARPGRGSGASGRACRRLARRAARAAPRAAPRPRRRRRAAPRRRRARGRSARARRRRRSGSPGSPARRPGAARSARAARRGRSRGSRRPARRAPRPPRTSTSREPQPTSE